VGTAADVCRWLHAQIERFLRARAGESKDFALEQLAATATDYLLEAPGAKRYIEGQIVPLLERGLRPQSDGDYEVLLTAIRQVDNTLGITQPADASEGSRSRNFRRCVIKRLLRSIVARARAPLHLELLSQRLAEQYSTLEEGQTFAVESGPCVLPSGERCTLEVAHEVKLLSRIKSKNSPLMLSSVAEPSPASAGGCAESRWLYKQGDDLHQDVCVQLLFRVMNALWRAEDKPYFVNLYTIYPGQSGALSGFIECLPNAQTLLRADLVWSPTLHNSLVGANIAAFVLGIGDRHQSNMMLSGRERPDVLSHVDFGSVAGGRAGVFDAGPMPIPRRFVECCEKEGPNVWAQFVQDCGDAYQILRKSVLSVGDKLPWVLEYAAAVLAEPVARVGFPTYIAKTLRGHKPEVRLAHPAAARRLAPSLLSDLPRASRRTSWRSWRRGPSRARRASGTSCTG
jgi:hypothetical protein